MANTYTLLETITVGAATASSVTFNSIPQTGYTDLAVKVSARTAYAGLNDSIFIYPNGSGSNGTRRALYGTGSAAGSENAANIRLDYLSGNTATASTFGSGEIYIPNYTSSNYKSFSMEGVAESNTAAMFMAMSAGLWSITSAITSLQLTPLNGNFMQYSTFSLYGVAALGTTPTKAPKATGGDIIQTDGTYWYHAFLSSGTFTPVTALSCEVLVVGGGGAGGISFGAGGGAGGIFYATSQSVGTAQTVTIGAGGVTPSVGPSVNGNDSTFGSLTAGKAGGGGACQSGTGNSGGSGGGGTIPNTAGGASTQSSTGGTGYGFAGGTGNASTAAAGGGGAGSAGLAPVGTVGGAGGAGTSAFSSWGSVTGTGVNVGGTYYFAGGGSGNGTGGGATPGNGGTAVLTSGTPNSGAGCGGDSAGKTGGSGIVIVRYSAA